MIPGTTTKLTESKVVAADTIDAKTDIVVVSAGAATINTIRPNFGGGQFSGLLILIPQTAVILGTTGNILVGITCAVNRPVWLVYVKSAGRWLINSGV